jgi:lycopene beta-cyclase
MPHYDYLIAGGGAAGLSLAYHMLLSPLRQGSILIVDKDDDDQLARNWGYWANRPTLFDGVAHHAWSQLDVVSERATQRLHLGDYQYRLMHGAQFYRFVLQQLAGCPNVSFAQGVIHHVEDGEDCARVTVNDDVYTARWVFDSVVRPGELKREVSRHQFLRMHFKGWEVETPCPAFDPRAARMFDFRTPQKGNLRFFYLMPFSESHAFVEYTIFSENVCPQDEYELALYAYIEETFGIRDYRVISEENGAVPLTDYPFVRCAGKHVMTLGAKGGRVKPSTGYSFMRVQHDSEAIVRSMLNHAHPFDVPPDPPIFRFCDALLLQVMRQHGEQVAPIYRALFRNNPIRRVLRFLDEQTSPLETLALIASLPSPVFLQMLAKRLLNAG